MNRYKVTKQLGDGTYGSVLKAVNRQNGEIVSTLTGAHMATQACLLSVSLSRRGSS